MTELPWMLADPLTDVERLASQQSILAEEQPISSYEQNLSLTENVGEAENFLFPVIALLAISLSLVTLAIQAVRRSKAPIGVESVPLRPLSRNWTHLVYEALWILSVALAIILGVLLWRPNNLSKWTAVGLLAYSFLLGCTRLIAPQEFAKSLSTKSHANGILALQILLDCLRFLPAVILIEPRQPPQHDKLAVHIAASVAALLVSFISPRTWTPAAISLASASHEKAVSSPEQTCSYFSYFMSYGWLTSIIMRGSRRRLNLGDMLPMPEYDEPTIWRDNIFQARRRFKTTLKTLAYALSGTLGRMVFFAGMTALVEFAAPMSLYQLLHYLQNPEDAVVKPWVWVLLIFVGSIARSVAYQQYIFNSTRFIVRTKICLIQELYAKAMRSYESSASARHTEKVGELNENDTKVSLDKSKKQRSENVTNLMAYDVDAICNSRDIVLVSVATPIEIVIGMTFLHKLFGPCAFIALLVLLTSFPAAAFLSRRMSGYQQRVMKATDRRVSTISEYLNSINTIKYLAWEKFMSENINAERRAEAALTWKRNIWAMAVVVVGDSVPQLALFAMFVTYTLVLGQGITAAKAFTAVSVIETLRLQFVWIANITRFISQGRIAVKRIDQYMANEPDIERPVDGPPRFDECVVRRALDKSSFRLHAHADFVVGGLNVITGASGGGKSTLLLSLLGETVRESGTASCPRDVAYASQTPWLINDTIRANIVLYAPFHKERYGEVVEACGSLPDLAGFQHKDLTEVGSNASNLSGGQKQRISLARAIYAHSSTLLLDDVFSALDAPTQRHIWDRCFRGHFLQGRTVILVTQMQAAIDAANLVLETSQGRVIVVKGGPGVTAATTPATCRSRESLVSQGSPTLDSLDNNTPLNAVATKQRLVKMVGRETISQGRNPRNLFYQYLLLFGGHGHALLALFLVFVVQLCFFAVPFWISIWVRAAGSEDAAAAGFYTAVYGCLLLSFSLSSCLSQSYFQLGAWRVAQKMHKKLVSAVMNVTVYWHNKNPAGQVINRFSRDIFSLDSTLVDYLRITLDNSFRLLFRLTAIGSIMPIFALPAAAVCTITFACAEMYTRTQLSVKALSSAAQSPIFSFFNESTNGKSIVRARGSIMQAAFGDGLAVRLRVYTRAAETQYNLNRWICVRADASAALIALATATLALSLDNSKLSAALVGFSLTNAVGLGQTILNLVRNMNELEVELNCLQRAKEYVKLPPEEADGHEDELDGIKKDLWPSKGKIEFRNVTAKYDANGPDILRNVSFTISPGERVAVVGRTGSGKSTLALSLIAFTTITSGSILVDDVDISTIRKRRLRQSLTVVPQEPVLFGGDVRFNLDPTRTHDGARLAEAIETCGVMESLILPWDKSSSSNIAGPTPSTGTPTPGSSPPKAGVLSLDEPVGPRGSDFSLGQRQVLSLARATVRQSQVVILDEATASVDYKSDAAIQEILRSAFHKKTILAVIHRLSTILDYDRIIVMEAGQIKESGAPVELYQRGQVFAQMVEHSIQQGKGGEWAPDKLKILGR